MLFKKLPLGILMFEPCRNEKRKEAVMLIMLFFSSYASLAYCENARVISHLIV
ncbi:hypothetical protein T11_1255 [Trichinella zimbabwensis]|uniref:Uncharacterized protein n=1 Tax=Trichinella zimbabwensis TaxID=268475 RepID=A0A0V1GQY4_9BILA|nr:hypothetical protein T11_1255 [Trichinella zimbabwensis]